MVTYRIACNYYTNPMRFKKLRTLVVLTILTLIILFILMCRIDFQYDFKLSDNTTYDYYKDCRTSKCEVVHIGIVRTGSEPNVNFYRLLKSIYFFRDNPLHFHMIVDDVNENIVKTLFETWAVPQVTTSFYNINNFTSKFEKHRSGPLELLFPLIIPPTIANRIIVLSPNLLSVSNIGELWRLFNEFKKGQIMGLAKKQYSCIAVNPKTKQNDEFSYNTDVILYHLDHLNTTNWENLRLDILSEHLALSIQDQDGLTTLDTIQYDIKKNLKGIFPLPCSWNSHITSFSSYSFNKENAHQPKILKWNLIEKLIDVNEYYAWAYNTFIDYNGNFLRWTLEDCKETSSKVAFPKIQIKQCLGFPDARIDKRRTLLFFKTFQYTQTGNDITLVTQLSYEKMKVLEEIGSRWNGPISLGLYITDSELQKCIHFIENSEVLKNRVNIGYHAMFKEGIKHPINALRNLALNNVKTPYVFLNDMDFVPMEDLYTHLKKYISNMKSMNKKALVVPAFETKHIKDKIPKNKEELLQMVDNKVLSVFQFRYRPQGHGPSNYTKWKSAKTPYQIEWSSKYEPYIVVQSNVTKYDERFFGYGWNKIVHIMELVAQGYKFIVLPNAFVVHKEHPISTDKTQFLRSPKYKKCLRVLKVQSANELYKKYGRKFKI